MGSKYNGIARWLRRRECGRQRSVHARRDVKRHLYLSMSPVGSWSQKPSDGHGGIFNFDFSPDGSLLVAACERASVLMFDPFNAKLLNAKSQAHTDCVNCVRFLDSRVFATCSDDTTVCLWDTRYLKHKIRTLRGHSNWVKNIEYCSNSELLVTSGFDGSIYTWDINKYSEYECAFQRVFHTNGLMRTKITPDCTRLVIATSAGYLMIIHDLDLMTLSQDLQGFKPYMYRVMQVDQSPLLDPGQYNHVFSNQRNRVELISDFPSEDKAEMIASLEVHPQGWCAVSRNTSGDESSEWTCVHDIQTFPENEEEDPEDYDSEDDVNFTISHDSDGAPVHIERSGRDPGAGPSGSDDGAEAGPSHSALPSFVLRFNLNDSSSLGSAISPSVIVSSEGVDDADLGSEDTESAHGTENCILNPHSVSQYDTSLEDVSDAQTNSTSASPVRSSRSPSQSPARSENSSSSADAALRDSTLNEAIEYVLESYSRIREQTIRIEPPDLVGKSSNKMIRHNRPRLTHYTGEPNVGRGFIKEVCFSSDGRLICSPFGNGIRLLAFDNECNELCDARLGTPQKLYELTSNISHCSPVVTCKFSPTHCLAVSGCLNGKVDFHQPRF